MTEGEKKFWLMLLRGDRPLTRSHRVEIAGILEAFWRPQPGRPPKTRWGIANHNLRAIGLREEIKGAKATLPKSVAGEASRGARAEELVANRHGISVDALKKRLAVAKNPSKERASTIPLGPKIGDLKKLHSRKSKPSTPALAMTADDMLKIKLDRDFPEPIERLDPLPGGKK